MERATDGTAAGIHLRGTLARLQPIPEVRLVRLIADRLSFGGDEPYLRKSMRIARLNWVGLTSWRRGRVLLARYHPLMLPTVLIWKLMGGLVVLSVQGSMDDVGGNAYTWLAKSRVFKRISALSTKLADAVIVGAPVLHDYVRDNMIGAQTILVSIPNGVFLDDFRVARESDRPTAEDYAVFVGNLASWQGIAAMVQSTEEQDWPRGLPLVVVGDGVDRDLVVDRDGVAWKGRLPSDQAARWLAHAYCALALKRSDTTVGEHGYWPFKMIESAAAGVPIVTSDAKGLVEAAEEFGNAIVVKSGDSVGAAQAVRQLMSDRQLRDRLARNGLLAAENYGWELGSEKLAALLNAVVSRSPRSKPAPRADRS